MLDCFQMKEANLPVRYLGVPLISKKLSAADCGVFVEKVSANMHQVLVVQAINFWWQVVLCSSIFILPKQIIRLLE